MPPPLCFKARFVPLVLNRTKRFTLRPWPTKYEAGQTVQAFCLFGEPPFATLVLTAVEPIRLGDLTAADARADGLRDLADLRASWDAFYPATPWDDNQIVARITFNARPWVRTTRARARRSNDR